MVVVIASALGISPGAVKRYLSDGLAKMAISLADDGTAATPVYPDFDPDAVATARALSATLGDGFLAETGCPLFPLAGLPKMLLPTPRPVRWWLGAQDYVTFRLTGRLAVSAGSACAADSPEASHVLLAMGVAPALARGAVRVSLGRDSDAQELRGFLAALRETAQDLIQLTALSH